MQSASPNHGGTKNTEYSHLLRALRVSVARTCAAFCILNLASLAACAKSAPAPVAAPAFNSTQQLQYDLTAATKMPGVQRATWGIAVQSLARNQRLFDLNAQTLMVPASVAKLVSVARGVAA